MCGLVDVKSQATPAVGVPSGCCCRVTRARVAYDPTAVQSYDSPFFLLGEQIFKKEAAQAKGETVHLS